jgi:hypothetical protein
MRKNFYTLLLLLVLLPLANAGAQSSTHKFHSIFILNFIKYVEWPSSTLSNQFVIGVLDDNQAVFEELARASSSRKAAGMDIVVKKIDSADEASKCNLLYVSSTKSAKVEDMKGALSKNSVLLVTDQPGMCKKGSIINFIMKDGKWKFELNKSAAEKAGLRVANELVKVSINV